MDGDMDMYERDAASSARYESPVEADVRRDPYSSSPQQDLDVDKLKEVKPHDKTGKPDDKPEDGEKPEEKKEKPFKPDDKYKDTYKGEKLKKPEPKEEKKESKPDSSDKGGDKKDKGKDKKGKDKKDKDKDKKSDEKPDKVSKTPEDKEDNVEVKDDTIETIPEKQENSETIPDVKHDTVDKCIDINMDNLSFHEDDVPRSPPPDQFFGVRHLQTLMMFLCLVISYALRVNISVAIVAMSTHPPPNPDFEVFDWDEKIKTTILSSFFWGYVVTQVPAGQLAQRFGPKMLLVGSATTCSIFTILTPVMASWGDWKAVCASRVMQGLSQGFVFPCIHTLLAKWAPVEERGRMSTYSYAGAQFGTILSLALCGVIAESAAGWPTDFYLFGVLGICWAVAWFFVGSNSPEEHPFISKEERAYIMDSLSSGAITQEKKSTPWTSFLTSVPLWALIIVHSGQNWGFWTLLTEMPNYMDSVLKFSLKSNGMLSALPYLMMWLLSFVFSWVSDYLNKKQCISLSASRKLFNSIAHWGPAIALIALSYSNKDTPYAAVALLTIAVGLNAGTYVGFQVNHIDLSPNYAGTMMGITNCIANILSIVAPLAVGGILTDSDSIAQWRTIFFIAAGIYFFGNLVFIIFGSAEVQPWNDPDKLAELAAKKKDKEGEQKDSKFETCLSFVMNMF